MSLWHHTVSPGNLDHGVSKRVSGKTYSSVTISAVLWTSLGASGSGRENPYALTCTFTQSLADHMMTQEACGQRRLRVSVPTDTNGNVAHPKPMQTLTHLIGRSLVLLLQTCTREANARGLSWPLFPQWTSAAPMPYGRALGVCTTGFFDP